MPSHVHRMRPVWLLPMSPADYQGWYRIVTYARCTVCGAEAVLAGEQNPQAVQGRIREEGT